MRGMLTVLATVLFLLGRGSVSAAPFALEDFLVDHVAGFDRLVDVQSIGGGREVAAIWLREEGEDERLMPGLALVGRDGETTRLIQVEYVNLSEGRELDEDGIDLQRLGGKGKGEGDFFLLRCSCLPAGQGEGRFIIEERLFRVDEGRLLGLARVAWGGDDEVIEGRRILDAAEDGGGRWVGVLRFRQEPQRPFSDVFVVEKAWEREASLWAAREVTEAWPLLRACTYPYLSEDLDGLTREELCWSRNAIFARYGRGFSSKGLLGFFLKQPWYHVDEKYDPERLADQDWRNVETLGHLESLRRLSVESGDGTRL